jgi:DNA-binding NarL/FixJ family response regulator
MINVIITDDHPVVYDGLKKMLDKQSHIKVIGIYNSAAELMTNIFNTNVDVLILDMQLPDGNGFDIAQSVLKKKSKLKILVFSSTETVYQIKKMLNAGCLGYLPKNADGKTIIKAIESVYQDKRFLSPALEAALLDDMIRNKDKPKQAKLTRREKEVLDLIVKEYTNSEMASELFLSQSTIDFHRNSLLQKLNVKNTAGLVRVAIESGLV